ncbi:MAG: hypothetical protein JJU25_06045 [Halomonas sp.]|nr:hypothetical protein [Halomonas sp.]MCC5882184.1 hypothetical protein [Halomonas sp.]
MRYRPLTWLFCLLLGIVFTLPQAAMSAWNHGDEDCQAGALSVLDIATVTYADSSQAQTVEQAACAGATPICTGASLSLLALVPRSPDPRWGIDEAPLPAARDRLERPPRV